MQVPVAEIPSSLVWAPVLTSISSDTFDVPSLQLLYMLAAAQSSNLGGKICIAVLSVSATGST